MARIRIRKTKNGIRIKATGTAAQQIFDALTKNIKDEDKKADKKD